MFLAPKFFLKSPPRNSRSAL